MYATDYEDDFFLKVTARINFGASSKEPIQYPDDPYDRIWESDAIESLTYRLNLEDLPANARAYAYLAEIKDSDSSRGSILNAFEITDMFKGLQNKRLRCYCTGYTHDQGSND
eukprot:Gb_03947 [translate_table: standard]